MWLWLLITASLSVVSLTSCTRPELRPPSVEKLDEASLLWTDGKNAFELGRFAEATQKLQRLVDRYPASENYLEAQHLLGQSFLKLSEPGKAIAPLRTYVELAGRDVSLEATPLLGNAYLKNNRAQEAYQVSLELLAKKGLPLDLRLQGLLLKTQALLALDRNERASQALAAFHKEARNEPEFEGSDLNAPSRAAALTLKIRNCAKLPSSGPLKESQVLNQMSRKGDCLVESALQLRKVALTGDVSWVKPGGMELETGYQDYLNLCKNPPLPPGNRSLIELRAYLNELSAQLAKDCQLKTRRTLVILKPGDKTEPLPDLVKEQLEAVHDHISKKLEIL